MKTPSVDKNTIIGYEKESKDVINTFKGNVAQKYDWSTDEDFVAALDKASNDFKSGKETGIPSSEVKEQILASAKIKVAI